MSQLSSITSYLPPSDGLLPKWLLFIAIVSIGNSIQCYASLAGSREVYSGTTSTTQTSGTGDVKTSTKSPVNALSARTFGTWTALSSVIRLYAAYNINDARIYELCLWTYGLALIHFLSEWLIFGSAKLGRGLMSPLLVATGTCTWMLLQWSSYVR